MAFAWYDNSIKKIIWNNSNVIDGIVIPSDNLPPLEIDGKNCNIFTDKSGYYIVLIHKNRREFTVISRTISRQTVVLCESIDYIISDELCKFWIITKNFIYIYYIDSLPRKDFFFGEPHLLGSNAKEFSQLRENDLLTTVSIPNFIDPSRIINCFVFHQSENKPGHLVVHTPYAINLIVDKFINESGVAKRAYFIFDLPVSCKFIETKNCDSEDVSFLVLRGIKYPIGHKLLYVKVDLSSLNHKKRCITLFDNGMREIVIS